MPPAETRKTRCFCTSYSCNTQFDSVNQTYGVLVEPRVYRKHQESDRAANLRQQAENELALYEENLTRSLHALALDNQRENDAAADAFERTGVFQTVERIGQIKDDLRLVEEIIVSIGLAPLSSSHESIQKAIDQCCTIREDISRHEHRLATLAQGAYGTKHAVVEMLDQAGIEIHRLLDLLNNYERSWKECEQRLESELNAYRESGVTTFDSSSHFEPLFQGVQSIVQLAMLMVVACSIILRLPRRGTHWLFSMIEYIIKVVAFKCYGSEEKIPRSYAYLLDNFPRDVRGATKHFNIESKSIILAACPKCHSTYPFEMVDGVRQYPRQCTFLVDDSTCDELLVRPKTSGNKRIFVPIKPFITFDIKDWMANLLSREGYEAKMDAAWERMGTHPDGVLTDIFQGSIVQDFKRTHFSSGDPSAGRYLFSLSFDFFNPLGNRQAGKKISLGILSLVCVNLPIEERYKPENMFLAAIVPGPSEPSLDLINHYTRFLVDVLLQLWKGVFFSDTALHRQGRLILCALIAVVCDLPAARKIAGFASAGHRCFCSMCWCNREDQTYNDYDYASWKLRTNEECRAHAELYRSAVTQEDRAEALRLSGARWSELLRLPYFDPSKMVVVDPMHNLYLGLIKEHFQNILGYRPKRKDQLPPDKKPRALTISIPSSPENPLPEKRTQKKSVQKLISFLEQAFPSPMDDATFDDFATKLGKSAIHVPAFIYVARGLGLVGLEGNKKEGLARIVLSWRRKQVVVPTPLDTSVGNNRGNLLTDEDMREIRRDVKAVIKPTWISSVPTTLSFAGPKLKSDQWRSIGALYLPLTLIRLWSSDESRDEGINEDDQRRQLLDLTMHLCSAIVIASSRVTSKSHAELYLSNMAHYREELARLFPDYACHPNHHVAFHITELLLMYGPVHGWWTFPFERMIGMLQRLSTNYKPGEYEVTIGTTWSRMSNLRAFFSKTTCPQPIAVCRAMFEKLVSPGFRNSLSLSQREDNHDFDEEAEDSDADDTDAYDSLGDTDVPEHKRAPFPDEVLTAFSRLDPALAARIQNRAVLIDRVTYGGVLYSRRTSHEGNSGVVSNLSSTPFSIENIVTFPSGYNGPASSQGPWFIVRRFAEIQVRRDPYLAYPLLRAKLWAPKLLPSIEILSATDLRGHFAKCPITWEGKDALVIISLSRVYETTTL